MYRCRHTRTVSTRDGSVIPCLCIVLSDVRNRETDVSQSHGEESSLGLVVFRCTSSIVRLQLSCSGRRHSHCHEATPRPSVLVCMLISAHNSSLLIVGQFGTSEDVCGRHHGVLPAGESCHARHDWLSDERVLIHRTCAIV